MEYRNLEKNILEWAKDKGLLANENKFKQMLKCVSEVGELSDALISDDLAGIIDGIGDTFVTLIILSRQLGLDPMTCLESAYDEIKDRTGRNENGIFIKDGNL